MKPSKIFKSALIAISFLIPSYSLAFSLVNGAKNFKGVVCYAIYLIHIVNPILMLIAFLVFFWGLSKFILTSGSPAELEKGRKFMIWGVVVLFILLSFQAIVGLVTNELFATSTTVPTVGSGTGCEGATVTLVL